MTTAFLIPQTGLIVRDPGSFTPLADAGEEKPLSGGKEGRYWRRRINDGTVTIRKSKVETRKRKQENKENK